MAYQGLVAELPLGQFGYNANHNVSQVQPGELIQANNITYEFGTLQKEGGSVLYTPAALSGTPIIYGGHDWWPTATTQRSVIVAGTTIKKDSGVGSYSTTLASGLATPALPPIFVDGGKESAGNNRKLFIYTGGSNAIQVLSADGNTTTTLSKPSTDWTSGNPICGAIHQNRHVASGANLDPYRIYYSQFTDHEDFTDPTNAGSFTVYPGEGIANYALVPFKGQLIIFRYPLGVYAANMQDASPSNWSVTRLSNKVGICSPRAWVAVNDDILFMDTSGKLRLLSTVIQYGSYGLAGIGDSQFIVNFTRDNINPSRMQDVQAVYYNYKQEAHFAMSKTGSTQNNVRLVMDMNSSQGPRFRYSDKDALESLWLARDTNLIDRINGGDHAGQVWTLDNTAKSVNGAGFVSTFQTAHYDMAWMSPFLTGTPKPLSSMRKQWDFIELVVEPKGNWNLNVDIYHDGDYFETVTFNMGSSGQGLGSFTLDTDVLASDEVSSVRKRIHGSSHRISFTGYLSGANQDFSIAKLLVYFRPTDERK